jgi:hypothetical protein
MAIAGALCAGVIAACSSVGDPDVPFALEFTRLPWPAIVYGDTLRDSTGAVAPLSAIVLNSVGDTLRSATPAYVTLDTGLVVAASRVVTAPRWQESAPRVVATLGRLQSRPLPLTITRRPDSVFAVAASPITVDYDFPVTLASNTSAAVQVRIRSRQTIPSVTGDSVSRGWPVRFSVLYAPPRTVMDSVLVIGESGTTRTTVDTTDASGVAGVRVRVVPLAGQTAADSVVLQATATHRGAPIPGSPVRLVVRLRRATVAP